MDSRQRIDDAYRRRLQRIKVRRFEHPSEFAGSGKNTELKFNPLKLVFFIVGTCIVFMLFSPPSVCHRSSTSCAVSRWIWGDSDRRYVSDFDVSWEEILRSLDHLPQENKLQGVGLLNFNEDEIHEWRQLIPSAASHVVLHLDYADHNLTWGSLYPEWIDEEENDEIPSCPSLPSLEIPRKRLGLIAVKLPCQLSKKDWSRDVARLHLQIAASRLAVSYKGDHPVYVLFVTECFPIPNLFTCNDLVARDGHAWLYKPNLSSLRDKLSLPIGSCELAVPLGSTDKDMPRKRQQRVAYATILHSAYVYVCGAIVAAQSIRMSGSTRDLVILVDESINDSHKTGLELAGWQVRTIQRIRNPKAEKDAYNEFNYSKFRLWQLTDYDKIVFIDADMLILRNIDFLFGLPEISATGNSEHCFNSGVMVIEPSNCTFHLLMDHVDSIESYNGGDQGYLNEMFTWWHRAPRHINFLKHFWIGDDEATKMKKVDMFKADPPILYVLHYLGNKPWMCFRDYDCNWNVDILQEFASDEAHERWWKVHDMMPDRLQDFCALRTLQKAQLELDRRAAEKKNYSDGHWKITIRDDRFVKCIDDDCSWQNKIKYWGKHKAFD